MDVRRAAVLTASPVTAMPHSPTIRDARDHASGIDAYVKGERATESVLLTRAKCLHSRRHLKRGVQSALRVILARHGRGAPKTTMTASPRTFPRMHRRTAEHRVLLDQDHFQAMVSGRDGRGQPGRPRADDEQIAGELRRKGCIHEHRP